MKANYFTRRYIFIEELDWFVCICKVCVRGSFAHRLATLATFWIQVHARGLVLSLLSCCRLYLHQVTDRSVTLRLLPPKRQTN